MKLSLREDKSLVSETSVNMNILIPCGLNRHEGERGFLIVIALYLFSVLKSKGSYEMKNVKTQPTQLSGHVVSGILRIAWYTGRRVWRTLGSPVMASVLLLIKCIILNKSFHLSTPLSFVSNYPIEHQLLGRSKESVQMEALQKCGRFVL